MDDLRRQHLSTWIEGVWYERVSPSWPAGAALALGELAWNLATRRRAARRSAARAALPTIGISSPTVGGSGKTPLARWVAEQVNRLGYPAAVVTRGHGGTCGGPIAVDLSVHQARDVGDEPVWLAAQLGSIPVIVSRDRQEGVATAKQHGACVAVLDDAVMLRAFAVDLELMVLGAAGWIGNGRCLPAGPLRVPAEAVRRADALVVVVEPGAIPGWRERAETLAAGMPVVVAHVIASGVVRPDGAMRLPSRARGMPVVAWSGIARPWRFRHLLLDMGVDIRLFVSFPDHHRYSRRDVERLARQAEKLDGIPLTTAKDRARWPSWARWTPYSLEVEFGLDDAAVPTLLGLINGALHG